MDQTANKCTSGGGREHKESTTFSTLPLHPAPPALPGSRGGGRRWSSVDGWGCAGALWMGLCRELSCFRSSLDDGAVPALWMGLCLSGALWTGLCRSSEHHPCLPPTAEHCPSPSPICPPQLGQELIPAQVGAGLCRLGGKCWNWGERGAGESVFLLEK